MKRLLALAILALLLCGCSGGTELDVSDRAPAPEDRLVVFSCLEESVGEPLVKEFRERTGIWVQVQTGSARELMDRIAAGEACDLLLGCGADFLEANGDWFLPCRVEAAYSQWVPEGSCWTPLSLQPLVIVYNTKLVRRNLPTGWDSLLSDAWKGEIAFADPDTSEFSRTVLWALTEQYPGRTAEETLGALAANLETLLDSTEAVVSRVADGEYCLAAVPEDVALRRMRSGAELAIVYPEEGTYLVPDCGAIPVSCAHPENARAFLEFAVGADTQNHAWDTWDRGPVLEELAQLPGNSRFYDAAEAGSAQAGLLEAWEPIWGEAS